VAHANRLRFPRTAGARRKVTWNQGPNGSISNIITSTVALFALGSQATIDDLTLVRIRGQVLLSLSAVDAVNEGFRCYLGICSVSENAFNAGVAAVPAPLADIGWDGWIWHYESILRSNFATFEPTSPMTMERIQIDNKAMRKVHNTDILVGVLETTELGDGSTMAALMDTRILDKLP